MIERRQGAHGIDASAFDATDGNGRVEEGLPHLRERRRRMGCPEKRSETGDVRRRHARSLVAFVSARRSGGEDVDSGRRDHGGAVGEDSQPVFASGGADRNDVFNS